MPQTTMRFATTNVNLAAAVTEQAWVAPANAQSPGGATADNGTDATGTANTLGLVPLGPTDWGTFGLLAEETQTQTYGGGVPIPAGATIVSVTTAWEIGVTAGTPTFFYGENVAGVVTEASVGVTTYPTVRTRTPTPPPRANLSDANFKMRARMTNSNATTNSTCRLDYVKVTVTWVVFLDKSGRGAPVGVASGVKKVLVSRSGRGAALGVPVGLRKVQVVNAGRAVALGVGAGFHKTLIAKPAQRGVATGVGSGSWKLLVSKGSRGVAIGTGSGIARVFTSALSGITRDESGAALASARVDAFRTSDRAFMGTTTSSGAGAYSIVAPSDQAISYWLRSFKAGSPNVFGTTDEDLKTTQSQVQGPPE
jgi:hypothetical protein